MKSKLSHFHLLAIAVALLSIGSYPMSCVAYPEADSTIGLKPVASFDFNDMKKMGEDAVSHDNKNVVVGSVRQVASSLGCAAEFDGKGRISIGASDHLNFSHSFSVAAWVNGSGEKFRTLELAGLRSPNFQVAGDKIYFVTNSDPRTKEAVDDSRPKKKNAPFYYRSALWSGIADVNLGSVHDRRQTELPLSGLEPKLQVVGDRMFVEYFGNDADGNWQIYTGASGSDGKGWASTQRTFAKRGYAAEQARSVQVVGNKVYYAFPLKDKNGLWQVWTATSNIDGSSWKAIQQTTDGAWIGNFIVYGNKVYYMYYSSALIKDKVDGDFKKDLVISSSNLDGSGWHEVRRIRDATFYTGRFAIDKNIIYYVFSKMGENGNAHLWTGKVLKDGSSPRERQRTFGAGNVAVAGVGIQVVGGKVVYAYSIGKPAPLLFKSEVEGDEASFWTASTNLDGDHWVAQRKIEKSTYTPQYKMLEIVGGKKYYDLTKRHYFGRNDFVYDGILAYSGSNILNKGDSYGIGMSASGSVSGFVNAGEDYLYRGEAPEDTAGAMVERKLTPGWHHVAVTYGDNILRLYVDGKLARESRYDKKPAANPFPLSIGDGFVGKIAQVMLFDRALNKSEVSTLAERHQSTCRPVVASGHPE